MKREAPQERRPGRQVELDVARLRGGRHLEVRGGARQRREDCWLGVRWRSEWSGGVVGPLGRVEGVEEERRNAESEGWW